MGLSRKVYDLCRRIPKGKVTTYKIIAEKLGTRAYRAVGRILNKNPHVDVPCHRVVGSDGRLVGFAHGIKRKKEVLQKEGIEIIGYKVAGMEKVLFRFRA